MAGPLRAHLRRRVLLFSRVGSGAGPRNSEGALGGFLLGATLGLVWTPCAGPVLGSILTLLATQKQPEWAATLLVFYAIGAAIPMFAIAYGGQYAATRVRAIAPYAQRLQQGFGVLIVSFAAAMYFQIDTQVTAWLTAILSRRPDRPLTIRTNAMLRRLLYCGAGRWPRSPASRSPPAA